jgi:hypothetical protein
MSEVSTYGGVLVKLAYPKGQILHVFWTDLFNPDTQGFLQSMARWCGVPTFMEPSLLPPRPLRMAA